MNNTNMNTHNQNWMTYGFTQSENRLNKSVVGQDRKILCIFSDVHRSFT